MEPLESPEPLEPVAPQPTSSFRPNRLTSGIVAGGAAVAMLLAGLGIASAQTDETPTPTTPPAATTEGATKSANEDGPTRQRRHQRHHRRHKAGLTAAAAAIGITEDELRTQLRDGKTIAAVATDKRVDVDKVVAAMVEEAKTRLAQAVTNGDITQAQADKRITNLAERITKHVNKTGPAGGHHDKGHRRKGVKAGLTAAAAAIGITEDELRTQLRGGKTIAAVATDKRVDVDKVVAAMVEEAKTRLAQAVTNGDITQAQADKITAELSDRITAHVNRDGRDGGHLRKGPGPDGDRSDRS